MGKEKLFFVGVKALIKNEKGQILILKSSLRDHGDRATVYWDIPGGRIEEGAGAKETLEREIEEEIGTKELTNISFFTSVISYHQIPLENGKKAGLVLMVYKVQILKDSQIKISDEHTEFAWVSPAEAAKKLADKYPPEFTKKLTVND